MSRANARVPELAPRTPVITGIGLLTALGADARSHLGRWSRGESAIETVDREPWVGLGCTAAARIRSFVRRKRIRTRMLCKLLTPSAAFAVAAAGEALADAGLSPEHQADELAVAGAYVGSVCLDRMDLATFRPALAESLDATGELSLERFATRAIHLIDPLFLVKSLPNGGLGGIAIEHRVLGPNLNITNGAVSGLQAIGTAAAAVRRGEVAIAVAGGFDSLWTHDSVAEHALAGRLVTGPDASKGYAVGEGAAFVIVESAASAWRRNARIRAVIAGLGETTSPVTPDAEGLERAARLALDEAEALAACPTEGPIDGLFGDGAGGVDDEIEAEAAQRLGLAKAKPATLYTSPMPAVGHTGAASGALSLIHAVAWLDGTAQPPSTDLPPALARIFGRRPTERGPRRSALVWNTDWGYKCAAAVLHAPP